MCKRSEEANGDIYWILKNGLWEYTCTCTKSESTNLQWPGFVCPCDASAQEVQASLKEGFVIWKDGDKETNETRRRGERAQRRFRQRISGSSVGKDDGGQTGGREDAGAKAARPYVPSMPRLESCTMPPERSIACEASHMRRSVRDEGFAQTSAGSLRSL